MRKSRGFLATGVPGRLEIALHEVDQCSRLGSLQIESAADPAIEFYADDVLVDLILVLAERHPQFVETDIAAQQFKFGNRADRALRPLRWRFDFLEFAQGVKAW